MDLARFELICLPLNLWTFTLSGAKFHSNVDTFVKGILGDKDSRIIEGCIP